MSVFLDPQSATYMNNDETDLLLSDENDYNFKYVPANQFKYIVKDVRRQRCREEEENIWASFVKEQELNSLTYNKDDMQSSVPNIKKILDENIKEADEELDKFEIDIMSNETNRAGNVCSRNETNQKRKSKVNNIRDLSPNKIPIIKDIGTGSTNLLLTIAKEEITPTNKSKQKLEDFNLCAWKSHSNHVITRNKQNTKQLLHVTNGIEYNSSPETTVRYDNIAEGAIYVRPDPFTMHKILIIQKKICELLDEITFRLENIPAPDGVKDLQRRKQCVAEFVIRFSRNYLYDLNRYVKDIQRHMCIISPRARIKPNHRSLGLHMHAIEHKLLTAHHLLQQALIAYCKHIPSSIFNGHPGKFKEILQVVVDLKTMCDRLQLNTHYLDSGDNDTLSLGKDMEDKCNVILSKLKLHSGNNLLLDSKKTPSMASLTPYTTNNKRCFNTKLLSNRLSMYNMDTKALQNNSKRKSNYYRTKSKPHNTIDIKQVSSESISDRLHPSSTTITSSKNARQTGAQKYITYAKEEDIKTMIDMLPIDSDHDSDLGTQERHDNIHFIRKKNKVSKQISSKLQHSKQLEDIEQLVESTSTNNNDELVKKVTMITEEHLSNLVPVIADLMSFVSNKQNESEIKSISTTSAKTLVEFMQKYQTSKSPNTKINANTDCDICHSSIDSNCECKQVKTSNVSITTQKSNENMQLICMSSTQNTSKIHRYCDVSCQANCENLTELLDFEVKLKQRKKITGLGNDIELIIPEETEINFFKYKQKYQYLMQSVPMYSSNTHNKPWDIVAWISDKLVDELIVEIAKELQIDDIIQKLFQLEFQEF